MNRQNQNNDAAPCKRPALPRHGGYILLPVTLGITLIATIAMLLNIESVGEATQAGSELQTSQAQYIAEAGFAHASWSAQNNVCAGDVTFQNASFANGYYTGQVDAAASVVKRYTLAVIKDTYIDEGHDNDNYGSTTEIKIRKEDDDVNNEKRGLFQFDLSAIPATERVVEAVAWFYITQNDSLKPLAIHAITSSWTEAGATWASVAGSIANAPLASIATRAVAGTWVSVNLTAMAQYWLNVPGANRGLVVLGPNKDDEIRLSAKEGNISWRPRLEIITANGAVSPVQVTATATFTGNSGDADNITRQVTQSAITAYGAPFEYVLQPDEITGKDVKLVDWKSLYNYGKSDRLEVSYGTGTANHSLLQFTLDIPANAKIESAELSLYKSTSSSVAAIANVRRITSGWAEGNEDNSIAPGATWLNRDSLLPWASPGGDMDPRVHAATTIPAGGNGWASWSIADLVQGWVNGSYPNYGLALVPGSAATNLRFYSSDHSDKTERPKLTIKYRCECGNPCVAPKGSAQILMVVDNALSLRSSDQLKKAQFEAWGYGVTAISDSALQLSIQSAASSRDVVYVSESARQAFLGNKLTNLTIGIVSEAGGLNNNLGLAASNGYAVSSTINIADNNHYISALFPPGPLTLYTGAMEQQVVAGGLALGLKQLGNTTSQGSLAVLEVGTALGGQHVGQYAAGRRVLLPLGRNSGLNWKFVNDNGLLLVHRSIEWAQQ